MSTANPTPADGFAAPRREHPLGGYGLLLGLRFASNGVVALPGFRIDRARFPVPVPLDDAFDAVPRHLEHIGRPIEALCGFDLRMPASLPAAGFREFNEGYLARLEQWGLMGDEGSPLARTNVAPTAHRLSGAAVAGFSYTVATETQRLTFVISGVAEVPDGSTYPGDIVRRGETSDDALFEKARQVVSDVDARVTALGTRWDSSVSVTLYSPHDLTQVLQSRVLPEIGVVPAHGITWLDSLPPAHELELEVDARCYGAEVWLPA